MIHGLVIAVIGTWSHMVDGWTVFFLAEILVALVDLIGPKKAILKKSILFDFCPL